MSNMADYLFAAPVKRQLSATKTYNYSPSTAFTALADISSYERTTSLIYSSSITSRDASGLTKTAKLKVGYPALALNEDWICIVTCDRIRRTVYVSSPSDYQSSVVESYLMKWMISRVADDNSQAQIKLDLDITFKRPVVGSMFVVLPDVAGKIKYRFCALIRAQDLRE